MSGDRIAVVDRTVHRLTPFVDGGTLLFQFGQEGPITELPELTRGLVLLSSGHVAYVVANDKEHTVHLDLFTRKLEFIERIDLTDLFLGYPHLYLAGGPDNTLCFRYRDPYEIVVCYRVRIKE